MPYGACRAIDSPAAQDITAWVFAISHLLSGMLTAFVAAIAIADVETAPWHRRQ